MALTDDQIETCSKKRGMAKASLDLIEAMHSAAEAAQPITGRGIGYKLFTRSLIPSMERKEMQRVYRLLRQAREQDIIPWEWIVDETRSLEKVSTWDDPEQYARAVARSYRRDFWNQQPARVQVCSEKGTIRGVLAPVLDSYAVGFRVMHGFSSATSVYDICQDDDGRPLILLYVGDYDPSGLYMSQVDLPTRIEKYDGGHIDLRRIALRTGQLEGLSSFPATDKRKDPRYEWFRSNYGNHCWELDAMDPNDLRGCVEQEIKNLIDPVAWSALRCRQQRREGIPEEYSEGMADAVRNFARPRTLRCTSALLRQTTISSPGD